MAELSYLFPEEVGAALDRQVSGGAIELGELMVDGDTPTPEAAFEEKARITGVGVVLDRLLDSDARLLSARFGLSGDDPKTLRQIAETESVSVETARFRVNRALAKCRHPSRSGFVRDSLLA